MSKAVVKDKVTASSNFIVSDPVLTSLSVNADQTVVSSLSVSGSSVKVLAFSSSLESPTSSFKNCTSPVSPVYTNYNQETNRQTNDQMFEFISGSPHSLNNIPQGSDSESENENPQGTDVKTNDEITEPLHGSPVLFDQIPLGPDAETDNKMRMLMPELNQLLNVVDSKTSNNMAEPESPKSPKSPKLPSFVNMVKSLLSPVKASVFELPRSPRKGNIKMSNLSLLNGLKFRLSKGSKSAKDHLLVDASTEVVIADILQENNETRSQIVDQGCNFRPIEPWFENSPVGESSPTIDTEDVQKSALVNACGKKSALVSEKDKVVQNLSRKERMAVIGRNNYSSIKRGSKLYSTV